VEIASLVDPLSDSNWASSHPVANTKSWIHIPKFRKNPRIPYGVINIAMGNSRTFEDFFSFNGKNQKSINGVLNIATTEKLPEGRTGTAGNLHVA